MKRFKTSIAAWSCIAALGSFALLYSILPYSFMSDLSTALAFGVVFAATCRYAVDAFRAMRGGRSGGEFVVIALFSICFFLLVQRGWVWFVQANTLADGQRPEWLLNTVMTVFIPWMLAWAVSMAIIAPEVGGSQMVTRPSIWRSAILFISGAAAGFVLASSFRVPDVVEASCFDGGTVLGSAAGIYHTETSPYRGLIRSGWCFKSIQEAQAAGFRAPR